eukprot:TRINITY_DN29527_c0_g1_i1.p1 TRINITY_DN29527_c0_g1~~TRINITY_DN29527_c0_g1_i1.p1  ORF type:complete len:125 (-),score=29.22 TRINITY_DN29527_c0_g1_i1:596-970(-)
MKNDAHLETSDPDSETEEVPLQTIKHPDVQHDSDEEETGQPLQIPSLSKNKYSRISKHNDKSNITGNPNSRIKTRRLHHETEKDTHAQICEEIEHIVLSAQPNPLKYKDAAKHKHWINVVKEEI